jgi:hypothetical protein
MSGLHEARQFIVEKTTRNGNTVIVKNLGSASHAE